MTTEPPEDHRLETYRLHEQGWEDYDTLRESFEWAIPDVFNIATYVCDRWAGSDRTALLVEDADGTSSHTFAELQTQANRFANFLRSRGIERGDRVAVNGSQRLAVLATHLACWKIGAISIPLSVLIGSAGLQYRLRDSGAKACVITRGGCEAFRAVKDRLPALETQVVVGIDPEADETGYASALEGQSAGHRTARTDPEDPAIVIYTSGTTGEPKGVVLPHQHLLGVLPAALCGLCNLEIREDDVGRTPVEWSWAGSFVDVVLPLLYYGVPIVATALDPFDPGRELELLDRHDVTITGGAPTIYRITLSHPAVENADLGSIRVLAFGGEAAGDALIERSRTVLPTAAVHELYGQSEAPLVVGDCEALGVPHRSGRMGKPAPGQEVRVVNPDSREPVDPGDVGELVLRREDNPVCFTEYWNAPEQTAEKVHDGWLRSEDLCLADEDGYLGFHSRRNDVIISSGYKVRPAEVEDALASHEAVVNAGVIGIPDEIRGESVKAFVELEDDADRSADLKVELQEFVKNRLAKYEYPRELVFVSELPTTTTGKVRRRSLREREGVTEAE